MGPVGMFIDRKARQVDIHAHMNAQGGPVQFAARGGFVGSDSPSRGPRVRSGTLYSSIRYAGPPFATVTGPQAIILTDAVSPRGGFNYPLALELGMPGPAGPLPVGQRAYGPYPFLWPALRTVFPDYLERSA